MSDPTPDTATGSTQAPMRKRGSIAVRVLLFVSLAANLAVAGIVVGAFLKHPPMEGPPRADRIGGIFSYALTHEDRREIGREMMREIRANRPERGAVKAEFQRILTALRSDPYDSTALRASLQNQLQEAMRRQDIGQKLLVERISQMSRKERMAFADRLEEAVNRPPRDKKSDK
ncbi:periplasmic heavy metal sensor [Pseudooceanicola sediminis]|nr:periplasmic heavy metal sensor [Pseudooceanicola sediminis]|tara:strand:+ start:33222 stop:33743 length:522 start_codon:yes stop_codon:yes gene_type:complete